MAKCCSCDSGKGTKNVMIYACSCGANVGEVTDRAARELAAQGVGTMSVSAVLGAGGRDALATARAADAALVLDGCVSDCARKVVEKAGLKKIVHVRVTDLGIEKKRGVRATDEQVAQAVAKAKEQMV